MVNQLNGLYGVRAPELPSKSNRFIAVQHPRRADAPPEQEVARSSRAGPTPERLSPLALRWERGFCFPPLGAHKMEAVGIHFFTRNGRFGVAA
jgi:hypothetical protein